MANKPITTRVPRAPLFVVYLTLPLLFIFPVRQNQAQSISKYYLSYIQNKGTLYYIFTQYGFKNHKHKSHFDFDITYNTQSDSAFLNFSYFDRSQVDIDSIGFLSANGLKIIKTEKILIDYRKNKWYYRYKVKLPFPYLEHFFRENTVPEIYIFSRQGKIDMHIKKGRWEKISRRTLKILMIIQYNKK